MLVVKDSMVLLHLAKTSLLEDSCKMLEDVVIPELVHEETVERGLEHGYPDAKLVKDAVEKDSIGVRNIEDQGLIDRANDYNIQGGEAEAVALYWQEEADLLATDDDNVREKRELLELSLIGTPVIIQRLFEEGYIDHRKLARKIDRLRDIGWFNTALLDKIILEAGKE